MFCTALLELGLGLGGVEVGDLIVLTDSDAPGAMAVHAQDGSHMFKGFVLIEAALLKAPEYCRGISVAIA